MHEVVKTIIGFILAALVVSFLYPSAIEMNFTVVPFAIFIPLFIVICLLIPFTALPVYLFATYKLGYSFKTVILSAVISIVLSSTWFIFPFGMETAIVGQKVLVQNGSITMVGFQYAFTQLFFIAIVGIIGGAAFYCVKTIYRKS